MRYYTCPFCKRKGKYPDELENYEAVHFGAKCELFEKYYTVHLILGEVILVIPWNTIDEMKSYMLSRELKTIRDENIGNFIFSMGT